MERRGAICSGFTLLELMVVFAVIAMILAIVAPRLLPMAAYFGQEGAARELAAYGESAIQYAKLNNEEIFVRFDLEKGEYWVEHWAPENQDENEPDKKPKSNDAATFQESIQESVSDPSASDEDERF